MSTTAKKVSVSQDGDQPSNPHSKKPKHTESSRDISRNMLPQHKQRPSSEQNKKQIQKFLKETGREKKRLLKPCWGTVITVLALIIYGIGGLATAVAFIDGSDDESDYGCVTLTFISFLLITVYECFSLLKCYRRHKSNSKEIFENWRELIDNMIEEILLYPALICTTIGVAANRPWQTDYRNNKLLSTEERLAVLDMILGCIDVITLIITYATRIRMLYLLEKKVKVNPGDEENGNSSNPQKSSPKKNVCSYICCHKIFSRIIYFTIANSIVFLFMILQFSILVYLENLVETEDSNEVLMSQWAMFMLVIAVFFPTVNLLAFICANSFYILKLLIDTNRKRERQGNCLTNESTIAEVDQTETEHQWKVINSVNEYQRLTFVAKEWWMDLILIIWGLFISGYCIVFSMYYAKHVKPDDWKVAEVHEQVYAILYICFFSISIALIVSSNQQSFVVITACASYLTINLLSKIVQPTVSGKNEDDNKHGLGDNITLSSGPPKPPSALIVNSQPRPQVMETKKTQTNITKIDLTAFQHPGTYKDDIEHVALTRTVPDNFSSGTTTDLEKTPNDFARLSSSKNKKSPDSPNNSEIEMSSASEHHSASSVSIKTNLSHNELLSKSTEALPSSSVSTSPISDKSSSLQQETTLIMSGAVSPMLQENLSVSSGVASATLEITPISSSKELPAINETKPDTSKTPSPRLEETTFDTVSPEPNKDTPTSSGTAWPENKEIASTSFGREPPEPKVTPTLSDTALQEPDETALALSGRRLPESNQTLPASSGAAPPEPNKATLALSVTESPEPNKTTQTSSDTALPEHKKTASTSFGRESPEPKTTPTLSDTALQEPDETVPALSGRGSPESNKKLPASSGVAPPEPNKATPALSATESSEPNKATPASSDTKSPDSNLTTPGSFGVAPPESKETTSYLSATQSPTLPGGMSPTSEKASSSFFRTASPIRNTQYPSSPSLKRAGSKRLRRSSRLSNASAFSTGRLTPRPLAYSDGSKALRDAYLTKL